MDGGRGCGDVGVDSFAEVNLVSFAAWDLIVYLQRNPDADLTLMALCTALARPEAEVAPALDRCVATGVADVVRPADGPATYGLSHDDAMRCLVARFVELASVREVRLEFVRLVVGRISG